MKLLIVEDDETIRIGLADYFEGEGYGVTSASDGNAARAALADQSFDLVLLDVMLPGPGGLEILREFRTRDEETPVLLLTARSDENDKILGLELGADDYITKPFSVREVAARVRAQLRRTQRSRATSGDDERFAIGSARVDLARFEVQRGDASLALSPKEAVILELLWAQRGRVVSRSEILRSVWGTRIVSDRTIDTHVLHLRQKLEDDPGEPRFLRTVHGVGYRLDAE